MSCIMSNNSLLINPYYCQPCETLFMKVFQTIHQYINMEVLTDQKGFISGENKRTSDKPLRYYNHINELASDDEDDDYNREFFNKSEHRLVDDLVVEATGVEQFDPDDDIFSDWSPSRFPKCYQVQVNRKTISMLTHSTRVLAPYIEAYMNMFKFLRQLEPLRVYKGNTWP